MSKKLDEYYMSFAVQASENGTCNRLKVGAVAVWGGGHITMGYNTSIPNEPTCIEVGCLINDQGRCIRTIHAEMNALLDLHENERYGSTLYVTHLCCENCMKHINRMGIKRIVYLHHYENKYNVHFTNGMIVEKLETDLWDK